MSPARQRIFTTVSALSLLVALAAAGLCARSYSTMDSLLLWVTRAGGIPPFSRMANLDSARGSLEFRWAARPLTEQAQIEFVRGRPPLEWREFPVDDRIRAAMPRDWFWLSAARHAAPGGPPSDEVRLVVPHVVPLQAAMVLPSLWLYARVRRRHDADARPPRRRVSRRLATASGAALLAVVALSALSFVLEGNGQFARRTSSDPSSNYMPDSTVEFTLKRGRIGVWPHTGDVRRLERGTDDQFLLYWKWSTADGTYVRQAGEEGQALRLLGFGYRHGSIRLSGSPGSNPYTMIVLPLWPIPILLAVLPAWYAYRRWVERARRRDNLCPACGYDLRASTGRCPECGMAINAVEARPSAPR